MREAASAVDATGRSFGGYYLHREIAQGGMARIHLATAISANGSSRVVAAKRLDPRFANDADLVAMFLDEARVASKVRHRNVVPVLDVVNIDGEVIMVQELVRGAPLHKLFARTQLERSPIPIPIAVSIGAQVLAGLHAAHEAVDETGRSLDIVHRDVSPQNIMIATDGTARLLDFGVAKTATGAHVTRTGFFKGKLAYSSPEQLHGKVTRQTDLYALAIVMWELLAGQRLRAGTDAEVFAAVMKTPPPRVGRLLASQRDIMGDGWRQLVAVDRILQRAFARDPSKRYKTATEFERALVFAVPPAPQADVATWLRSIAQDMIDETERLIAAEEDSWRKARGTGSVPIQQPGPRRKRTTTSHLVARTASPSSLHTIPTLRAPIQPRVWRELLVARLWRNRLPFTAGAVLVLLLGLSLGLVRVPRTREAAAKAPIDTVVPPEQRAPRPLVPARLVAGPVVAAPIAQPPVATAPARMLTTPKQPLKRRGFTKPAVRVAPVAKLDCAVPFYYEGTKKFFKLDCI